MTVNTTTSQVYEKPIAKVNRSLILIIGLTLILRLLSALYHGNTVDLLPGIHDQISYHELAIRVTEGHGFSFGEAHWPITPANAPTAHWSFIYTLFLAGIYWLAGVNPLIVRLIQIVIVSVAHSWLVYRLGKQVFNHATGLWATLLSAVYLYFIYYSGALMTEPFYIIGILWTLDAAMRIVRSVDRGTVQSGVQKSSLQKPRVSTAQWLELGLAIGFTMLMRQVFGLFVPFLFLWVWWGLLGLNRSGEGVSNEHPVGWKSVFSPLRGMIVASVVALLLIAPWTIRNYVAFGEFVPLNTNSGYAFFWGNHPIYGTSFVGILPPDGPTYQDLIPEELHSLNEAELDKALLRRGLEFVFDDPVRYILLSFSRSREYFKFWPAVDSSLISNLSRVGSFGILLPFMVLGLWQAAKSSLGTPAANSQDERVIWRYGFLLLVGFSLFYTTIHLMTWALIRYRLPVDALLLLFAAYSLSTLTSRWPWLSWLQSRAHERESILAS